jgi:hypothetical protein
MYEQEQKKKKKGKPISPRKRRGLMVEGKKGKEEAIFLSSNTSSQREQVEKHIQSDP